MLDDRPLQLWRLLDDPFRLSQDKVPVGLVGQKCLELVQGWEVVKGVVSSMGDDTGLRFKRGLRVLGLKELLLHLPQSDLPSIQSVRADRCKTAGAPS